MQNPRDEQVSVITDRDRWISEKLKIRTRPENGGPMQLRSSDHRDAVRNAASLHTYLIACKEHVRDYSTTHPVLHIHQFTRGKRMKWQTNILRCQTSKILCIIPSEFCLSTGWLIISCTIWFLSMLFTRGEKICILISEYGGELCEMDYEVGLVI